jgi:hypothetical protein
VPADLAPPLADALDDLPPIYADGCHRDPAATDSPACAYGDADAATAIVLLGDSHAAQWFPTLERLAEERGMRLVSLTKSACPFVDIATWSQVFNREYRECAEWREAALRRIEAERPALVVAAYSRVGSAAVDGRPVPYAEVGDAWTAALEASLGRLRAAGDAVLLLGDTPRMDEEPPACLSDHLEDASACARPAGLATDAAWTARDREAAARARVAFVDPTAWFCTTEPCGVVQGRFLVYRDRHHMTATYARALAPYLGRVLEAEGVGDSSAP